ncbi:hypothetical protein EON64_12080 [archaeon]|nr:MAG: hypothetical protein EON64_12080 [archaeon]
MEKHKVDGVALLRLDETFIYDVLEVRHVLRRRRLTRLVERLNEHQKEHKKVWELCVIEFRLLFLLIRYCNTLCGCRTLPWTHWTST